MYNPSRLDLAVLSSLSVKGRMASRGGGISRGAGAARRGRGDGGGARGNSRGGGKGKRPSRQPSPITTTAGGGRGARSGAAAGGGGGGESGGDSYSALGKLVSKATKPTRETGYKHLDEVYTVKAPHPVGHSSQWYCSTPDKKTRRRTQDVRKNCKGDARVGCLARRERGLHACVLPISPPF